MRWASRLHLLERGALVGGVGLGDTPLFAASFELRGQLFDVPGQRRGFCLGLGEIAFPSSSQTDFDFAQIAL